MLKGLRLLSDQLNRKRVRDTHEQNKVSEIASKRLKELEEAVKHSDTDISMFYELSKEHEGRAGYERVIKPFACLESDKSNNLGDHVHRLNSIMLQMRCKMLQETVNQLKVSLAQHEARANANEAENVWKEHTRKDMECQLKEKTHTISQLHAELNKRPPQSPTINKNNEDKLTKELEQARANMIKILKKNRDLESKLKNVSSDLGNAHQQRMHQARELSIKALDAGHVALCQSIETQLESSGLEREKINSFRLAVIPHVEAMRTALGKHLI